MNKSITTKISAKPAVNKALTAILICISIPLFLEFAVALPLVGFRLIWGQSFWILGVVISVTGLLAVILSVLTTIWFLLNRKRITDPKTRSLGKWIVGLTLIYGLVIGVMVAAYLNIG